MDSLILGLLVYVFCVSALLFLLCNIDKHRAVKGKWRIRESSLFLLALLGGSPGLWLGMYVFRHKTSHLRFALGVPVILLVQCCLVFLVVK